MLHYRLKLFSYKNLFEDLVNLEFKKKLPSRIIFSGQEGIGKSTLSFHLTNYLFSQNEKTKYNLASNEINIESLSHNHVIKQSHPNFYYISKLDGKTNIEIDQVRDMIAFLNKSSFDNNKKIILIDGVEFLNQNSSNALLKCLEESNDQNLFILTHNINQRILDTIKSRCISYKLNFNYSVVPNIISHNFGENLYEELNEDFKFETISPNFIIKHITFALENSLNIHSLNVNNMIKYIIDTKSYKKNNFIINNFQHYIEIYFTKMYLKTKDNKYYDKYLETISDNHLINKFNLDLDSFFIKFENNYLNI
tara:strand:+ start:5370 stop:6296 length:927 start_codon:yes stop_codon:yes gene_type:complete